MLNRKITLQDIGERLGLSATTVSLALRDHPRISEATKEKIRQIIKEVKYEPNQVARALVTGKSNLIGVIVPNSSEPYYAEIFRGIEDAARLANFHVLLSSGSFDMENYTERVKDMIGLRVAGIIAAPPFLSGKPHLPRFWKDLRESHFHLVLINRQLNPPIFHQVTADHISGVRMAVEALASLGHQRVAYISGEPDHLPIRQRLTAFRRFAKRQGFDRDPALFGSGKISFAGGYDACRRLWDSVKKKPTAIVALNDAVAVGVFRFLFEQNLQAPDDLSVIAFDSSAVGEFTQPSLSTVSTPVYEIGRQAFELLLGDVERKFSWPQNRILPVTLLLRESVSAPRAERKTA